MHITTNVRVAVMANWHIANWRMWQTDYGKLAYGKTTSYLLKYHVFT